MQIAKIITERKIFKKNNLRQFSLCKICKGTVISNIKIQQFEKIHSNFTTKKKTVKTTSRKMRKFFKKLEIKSRTQNQQTIIYIIINLTIISIEFEFLNSYIFNLFKKV